MLAAFLALGHTPARAASAIETPERSPVVLDVLPGCERSGIDRVALRRLLAIELDVPVNEPDKTMGTRSTRVQVFCQEALVDLGVVVAGAGKRQSRRLDFGATGPATRTRFVALSATELVTGLWLDVSTPAPDAKASVVATGAAARPERILPPPGVSGVGATAGLRVFVDGMSALWSLGLHLDHELTAQTAVSLDLVAAAGQKAVSAGAIEVSGADGGALAWRQARRGAWSVRMGLGARTGVLRVDARVADPDLFHSAATTVVWAGPALGVRSALDLGRRLFVALHAEAGWAALGTRAFSVVGGEFRLAGPFVGVTLAMGARP